MKDIAPLPHEWMLVGIIGFLVSWLEIYPRWSVEWGATFMIFFFLVFVASVVNMSRATTEEQHLEELAIHEIRKRR